MAGNGDTSKLGALSATRRMLEACKNIVAKAAGVAPGGGAEYGAVGGGGGAYYQERGAPQQLMPMGRREEDMVLM